MDALAGPVSYQGDPQALFGTESLAQALWQLEVYGRDGLPVLSADGHQIQGWITAPGVLRSIASQVSVAHAATTQAQATAEPAFPLSVLRGRRLRPPHPELVLMQGDHVNLLASAADGSPARPAANGNHQPEVNGNGARA